MLIKRKKQEIMVVFAVIVAIIIVNLQGKVFASDVINESQTYTLTTAHFAILNRGYTRPTTTKSEKQSKYTKVGDGKIYEARQIDNDDDAVLANIYEQPDVSSYINDGEKVVWYVCKKEADGWHIDGEIVEVEDESEVPSETESKEPIESEVPSETESKEPIESEVPSETESKEPIESEVPSETESEKPTQSAETTLAHFAILKSGYKRPTTTKSEVTAKYTKVGDGKIYETITIDNNDREVELNIAVMPDLSKYIAEDETVIWYVCKKEVDGWHIDGEVVKKDVKEDFANLYYEMLSHGETKEIDISEYALDYSDIKETIDYINSDKGYPLYWIFEDFDYEITQKNGKMETFKIKNVPENYETRFEEIVSMIDGMLYGRKLNDMETVEFIKNVLQKQQKD